VFRTPIRSAAVLGVAGLLAGAVAAPSVAADAGHRRPAKIKHVLLLSVDGLHQSDLAWYVRQHPHSALAAITAGGVDYTGASTPLPSDSFPGMVGQVTGGDPRTAGVYYDDTYNHALLPAGTTGCKGVKPGVEVDFTEDLDRNKASIDAGQGLTGLPGSILGMTGHPNSLIDPARLPVDPKTCKPVYPHSYLKVNTVFEVAKAHGYRTAWSDKHPAYEILNGPSGRGLDDLFTPEINSDAPTGGDWTKDNASTRQYDGYKVQAVLNEIDGYDHARRARVGTPGILGMNFQTVSTAQKLPASDGQTGGYQPDGTPGPLLRSALDWVNSQVGRVRTEIRKKGLARNTAIILSAKHGQSPTEPQSLTRIDDGPIIDAINKAWAATHPGNTSLVTFATDDDAVQMWLSDRSQRAADFVRHWLLDHPATGNTITGAPRTLPASGLTRVYAGAESARFFGVPRSDPRHPDVWGFVQHGVVYTGGKKKIAEHGGGDAEDRHVPLVVFVPGGRGSVDRAPVETTQIAPTILKLLGLDPNALQAVRIQHTKPLR
jgi:arylsulfatase A-like enzyme